MTPLTPTELDYLQGDGHRARLYLSVNRPRVLLSASLNNGAVGSGAVEIAYDGGTGTGFSEIQAGQTLKAETSFGVAYVRVRSITGSQESGVITVAANDVAWADNISLTVLEDYRLWAKLPRFDGAGIFYKDFDITYTDQNQEPNPACNAGPHRAVFQSPIASGTVTRQISQSSDDGSQFGIGETVTINGSTLSATSSTSWFGLRFQNVVIPQGAIIASATLTVNVTGTSADDPDFNIYAQLSSNAPTLTTAFGYISGLSRTTAFEVWTDTGIGTGLKDAPDLSAVIQEVVDAGGINGGLMIILDGLAAPNFTITAWDGNPALAASLEIEFGPPPTVIDIDLSESYAVAEGATISEYGLAVVPSDGVTLDFDTGTGLGTVTFEESGQYWLECSVTDSNGKEQISRRRVWVHSPDPDNEDYPYTDVEISSFHGAFERGGWSLSLTVRGSLDIDSFPEEALICLWYESWYGADKLYIGGPEGARQVLFVGYIQKGSVTANWDDRSVSFEAVTVQELLKEIVMYSISLAASRSPSKWYEYALWLTPGRAIHHILLWHSTFMEIADLYGLVDSNLRRKYAELQQNNLFSMCTEMARSISSVLCCNKQGQMYLEHDIQLLSDEDRAAMPVIGPLVSDYQSITIDESPGTVGLVTVSGLYFDGGKVEAFCAKAPGAVPAPRGAGVINVDRLVVADQTHANVLAGRHLAAGNNPTPSARLPLAGLWIGAFDLVPQAWWEVTATTGRIDWLEQKAVSRELTAQIDPANGFIFLEPVLEPEALGPPGKLMACIGGLGTAGDKQPPRWDIGDDGGGVILLGGTLTALYAFIDEASGVYYRDSNDPDWTQKDTSEAAHGGFDPWWFTRFRNNTYNPEAAVLWQVVAGAIYRSSDGGNTWDEVTPVTDPPNEWGDSPSPTLASLEFVCVKGFMFLLNSFYVLARWENGSGDWRGWLLWTGDNGLSWTWYALDDTDEVYPIWLSLSLGAGGNLWVTYLRDTNLYLSRAHPATPATIADEVDLGPATVAEILTREKWAFPVSAYGDDSLVFVAGRMEDPAGLSGITQVIRSTDGGSSFTAIVDDWDTDHCGAMMVSGEVEGERNYYAVRQPVNGA